MIVTGVARFDSGLTVEDTIDLFKFDADFTLGNGEGYLWQEAIDGGFDSNAAYLVSISKTPKELVKNFMKKERGYYSDYDFMTISGYYILAAQVG